MKAAIAGAFGRASRPLAWYYAIAVAVPVLNGATVDGAFLEHVAFVLVVPAVIVMAAGCVDASRRAAVEEVIAIGEPGQPMEFDERVPEDRRPLAMIHSHWSFTKPELKGP